jgi:hypothetical protein
MTMAMRLVLASVLVLSVGVARAQYDYPYGGSYHASTAEEGIARGMADIVRSAGEANLRNSEAAINYEEARSRYFDNRLKGANTYFSLRRANREYREETKREPPTSEQIFRINQTRTPRRLSPGELDPVTGQIAWPAVFEDSRFDACRQALDQAFAYRAESSGRLNPAAYEQIEGLVGEAQRLLREQIENIPAGAYTNASNFLKSLAIEARLSVT